MSMPEAETEPENKNTNGMTTKRSWRMKNAIRSNLEEQFRDLKDKIIPLRDHKMFIAE